MPLLPCIQDGDFEDIKHTTETLAQMPTIGRLEPQLSIMTTQVYSFVVHKRAKLFYTYNTRTLRILSVKCTLMQ